MGFVEKVEELYHKLLLRAKPKFFTYTSYSPRQSLQQMLSGVSIHSGSEHFSLCFLHSGVPFY